MSVGEKAPIWVKKGKFEMRNIERKMIENISAVESL